jgi:BlaI family transcriptional regulator, penicillinase repressor
MEKLTHQEKELMNAVWKTGEANVKLFLENMPEPRPPYTTIASTIKNLEKKGFVKSRLSGNAYLYKPKISEDEYKKKSLGNMVKDHFDNSYKELVTFFAKQKKLSAKDLIEIIDLIENKNK